MYLAAQVYYLCGKQELRKGEKPKELVILSISHKGYSYMEVVPSLYRHLGLAAFVNNIATVTNFLSVPFLISLAQTELRVIALIEA